MNVLLPDSPVPNQNIYDTCATVISAATMHLATTHYRCMISHITAQHFLDMSVKEVMSFKYRYLSHHKGNTASDNKQDAKYD